MGSEVVTTELLGAAERGRAGVDGGLGVERGGAAPVARGAGRGVPGRSGASVSKFPSKSGSCPNTVVSGSPSTAPPHFEQKRALSGNCWPQLVQNMCARILSSRVSSGERLHPLSCW